MSKRDKKLNGGIYCPFCRGEGIVISTRRVDKYQSVRRRRECKMCRIRWNTLEIIYPEEYEILSRKISK